MAASGCGIRRRVGGALVLLALVSATSGCARTTTSAAPSIGGRLLDEMGEPVRAADVCWIDGEMIGSCVVSDPDGRFELPGPAHERFRVTAQGFHARQLGVNALDAPVVLSRAPVLFVRLTDGVTGEPIEEGQVHVTFPSGRDFGPFPVNRAGVRVQRVLPVGEALLRPSAPGYGPVDPVVVRLEPGKETAAAIPLPPLD